jgi:Putative MetA-pathway of phenol degradation
VTNGTHIVSTGLVQIEIGGLYSRDTPEQHAASSPFMVRVGVTDWLEARIGADGALTQTSGGTSTSGFGNVQVGAKLRLWADPGGAPVLSVLPSLTLPTADPDRGLGSGEPDFVVAALTGTDVGRRGHIDVNYGIGSIGGGQGRTRFVQHLVSASLSAAVTDRWNPYAEVFWFSKTDPDGGSETSVDTGVIYELGSHFAIDGGVQFGVGGTATRFAAFGGVSMVIGAERALNGRQRKPKTPKATPSR